MHNFKKTFFCLGTLMIIVTGFFMPALASEGLNWRLYNSVEQMENKKISLDVSNSEENIKNAWTLFNLVNGDESASVVEISEKSRLCNLTVDKIKEISLKVLKSLDILDHGYDDFKAVPNLFIRIGDEMVAQSSVYWRCSWLDKNDMQQVMWIDDISGKMVGLVITHDSSDSTSSTDADQDIYVSDSDMPEDVMALVEYCKENYSADNVVCNKGYDDHYIVEMIMNENGYNLTYPISVYFEKDKYLFFNV